MGRPQVARATSGPHEILRRYHSVALPLAALGRRPTVADLTKASAPPVARSLLWGHDGFVRSVGTTALTATAAAVTLPALAAGMSATAAYALAGTATVATALALTGTLVGLWSATDLGHEKLLRQRGLRLTPLIATGLGFGPLLGARAAFTVAGAAMASTAVLLLAYLCAVRTGHTQVSLTAGVAMLSAAAVLGPTGWLVLGGLSAHVAVGAALCVASGSTLGCAALYAALRTVQRAPPTELVDAMELPDEIISQARLEGRSLGPLPPTIFNVPAEFDELARTLQKLRRKEGPVFGGYHGLCVATLYGPPGSGKTFSATGLAQCLGALFVSCDAASLQINNVDALPEAYMNLVTLLMEAQLKAERENRPAVVLIDEVDSLLPRADEADERRAFNDVVGFVLLLNVLSLLASSKTHLVLLMATNHPEQIAPLLGRMSQRPPIYMGPPDQAAMAKIFNTTLGFLEEGLKVRNVPHGDARKRQEIASFAARLHALGVTGRALSAVREGALQAALRANKKLEADNVPTPQRAQAVDAAIVGAIEQSLQRLAQRGSQSELNASYGRLKTGRQTLDEVDQLMQRMGLKNLDPFEIVRRLSEQLLSTYVDPSQSVPLSFLTSRFYMTLAQLAMLYAGQRLSRQEPQDITDVRPDAGAALFGQGDFKGKMGHVLKNTWQDLMRGRI